METIIWKYDLSDNINKILMPIGAEILTVQQQNNKICMWVLVNPKVETEKRLFEIHSTGNMIFQNNKQERKYIGTCQIKRFVWHVFELITN